jgi:hypothetical protein
MAMNVGEYYRARKGLESLYNRIDDVPVRVQSGVWEARCVHPGTAEAFQERVVVTAELDFNCWIDAAKPKKMVKETGDREHTVAFGAE